MSKSRIKKSSRLEFFGISVCGGGMGGGGLTLDCLNRKPVLAMFGHLLS